MAILGSCRLCPGLVEREIAAAVGHHEPARYGSSQRRRQGAANTRVLIGETPLREDVRSMGRFDFGMWFDPARTLGVSAGFFVTESKGKAFNAVSDGSTIIARPFTDDTTAKPSSVLVSFPGISSGSVRVFASSETFWGANLDIKEHVASNEWWRLESLFGYRYLHYDEGLNMQQILNPTGGAFVTGTKTVATDSFQTKNDFNGIEFGFNTEVFRDRWSLEILTKLGVGDIRREVSINGSTQTSVPGSTTTNGVGGVYALSSNIGNHFSNSWVVVPEMGLSLGYQVSSNVRLQLGYSILYLQDIARAGDQIDFTLNQALFPPAITTSTARPASNIIKSDIWVQSINFGVQIRY